MEEKTMLQGNEDVRSEMEKILWTPVENNVEEVSNESEEEVKVVMKDTKTPENEVEIPTTEEDEKPKVKKQRKAKSTGEAKVPANGEWINNIPENERLAEGDVLYCIGGDGKGRFAQVIGYGKKLNIVWANMFKKESTEFMSRPWSLTSTDTVVVKKGGELMEGFAENNGVYSIVDPNVINVQ